MTAFSIQISNYPVSFPELDIFQFESGCFHPSQSTASQDGDHGAVPPLFGRQCTKRSDKELPLLQREPVADAYIESASAFYSADSSSRVQESAIRSFIGQTTYCGESKVDRRWSIVPLLERNPGPGHDSLN